MGSLAIGGHRPSNRFVLPASMIGASIEFYDYYVYATAASLVFGELFFPSASPWTQQLSAYASLGLAFVARPVGALIFGHFGDRVGRKSTLVAALFLMGGSTVLVGLLPTYATAHALAPVLLCLLRFGQGIGLGGEWGGAALLAIENAPAGSRGRYSMFPQLGAPIGFMLSTLAFLTVELVTTPTQLRSWGWRLPFLASSALVVIGLWVRLRLTETPVFVAALNRAPPEALPLRSVVRDHGWTCFAGTFAVVACFAVYYISSAFALGYAATVRHFAHTALLMMQLGAAIFMIAGIVLGGWLSDRINARRALVTGYGVVLLFAAVLAPGLGSGSEPSFFLCLAIGFFGAGMTYGTLAAWLSVLFPPRVRYTGVSLAFNLAGVLGGALTPVMAQILAPHGDLSWVSLYLMALVVISLLPLLFLRRWTDPTAARLLFEEDTVAAADHNRRGGAHPTLRSASPQ